MMTPYEMDLRTAAGCPLPWEQLDGCRILVTGATGLIGGCLVDLLMEVCRQRDLRLDIYAMGRNAERAKARFRTCWDHPAFHFVEHDVTRPLAGDTPFHFIIHAASGASPQLFRERPVEVMKANLDGVTNLIGYGKNHGMKRFLYVSSGEVYGKQQRPALGEADYGYVDLLDPRSCYPSSKRAAETLTACFASEYGVDTVIARPCHTFGPYFTDTDLRAYAQFIRNVEAGEDIVLKGDGSQYRSWCYVVDCASAICHILLKGEKAQAYNIADARCEASLKEVASTIANLGRCGLTVGAPDPNAGERVIFDTARLASLGWETSGTLKDKLRHTLETRQQAGK